MSIAVAGVWAREIKNDAMVSMWVWKSMVSVWEKGRGEGVVVLL